MSFGGLWRRTWLDGWFCFSYDYTLNLCTFHFMFTLRGCSNLTCFYAHSQKVAINYPLAGGGKKKKKKKRLNLLLGPVHDSPDTQWK